MNKTIISLALVGILIFSAKPAKLIAIDTPAIQQSTMTNEQYVVSLVDVYSKKYGVSKSAMINTLKNENRDFIFDKQSGLTYKAGNRWGFPAGTQEKSYGICQIHLPDHPTITYEQAINPEFCVDFMAKKFSEGKQSMWMGYQS